MSRLAMALGLALALLPACERGASDGGAVGAPVVDAVLLAFLSKARAAHHQADLAHEDGAGDLAIRVLEILTRGPYPRGVSGELAPEVAEVLADTRARLADLRSDQGDFAGALDDVDEGLSLAPRPTHFRGHLFEVRGLVYERQARALAARGESDAAARSKAQALDAFDTAIKVQDQVIVEALGDQGKR